MIDLRDKSFLWDYIQNHRIYLIIIIFAAFFLRAVLTLKYVNLSNPVLWEFGVIAKNLIDTGTYSFFVAGIPTAYMPPGYPLIIAFFYKIFGIGLAGNISIAVFLLIFEICIPLLIWWLTKKIWDQKTAVIALLFSLFWPFFLIMSGRLHSIPIYTALLIFSIGILFSDKLEIKKRAVFCGLILGIYANFRFDAIPYLLVFAIYFVRLDFLKKKISIKTIQSILLLLICFTIPTAPWIYRNYKVFGKIILSTSGGINLIRGHHEKATGTARDPWPAGKTDPNNGTPFPRESMLISGNFNSHQFEISADKWYREKAISFIKNNPKKELKLILKKSYYFFVTDFTHPAARKWIIWFPSFAALILGFLFWRRYEKKDIKQQVLWMIFFVQMCISVIFFVLPRYRMSVDFIPLLFFSAGISYYLSKKIPFKQNST